MQGGTARDGVKTRIIPLRGAARDIEAWSGEGSHGGGDVVMLKDLFSPDATKDKYLRAADERGGAYAMLVGAAANQSIASGQPVEIATLVNSLGRPDYTSMPNHEDPIPMPPKRGKA